MNKIFYTICMGMLFLLCACTEENENVALDIQVTDIQRNSVTIIGKVLEENENGETEVYNDCGVYWSETNPVPTAADGIVNARPLQNGYFNLSLTDLKGATTYYVKGYAKNYSKTMESKVVTFTTPGGVAQFTAWTAFPGDCHVRITDLGGKEIKEAGLCGVVAREVPHDFMPDIHNSTRKPQKIYWYNDKHNYFTMSIPFGGNAPNSYSKETFYIRAYIITENGIGYSQRFSYQSFER